MAYAAPHLKHSEDDEACAYAFHVSLSCMLPIVLNAAIELHLFDIISQSGPAAHLSPSEISLQILTTTQINNPPNNSPPPAASAAAASVSMLDRMLELLATHSLLTCTVRSREEDGVLERLYGLAPAGKYFVDDAGARCRGEYSSLASIVRMIFHPACRESWFKLKDAIIEGGTPFQIAHGIQLYNYMDIDPTLNEVFNKSMVGRSTIIIDKFLNIYRGFEGLTSLVDVGGGIGKILNMIVSMYPFIRGINFDLPHVINSAPSYLGIEHVEGDMFSSLPKGDAVLLKNVLHNWGDEQCLKLLKNCYDAVPENGKVIIIESVKSGDTNSSITAKYATQLDNTMLLHHGGGKVRTEKELKALCKGSRFSKYQLICCAYSLCVMEFQK